MAESVLIAGCGDLGLRVARLLTERGCRVWGLRRSPPATPTVADMQWLTADLTRPDTLTKLAEQCGKVSHLVYLPTAPARTEAAYRAVFVDGLRNILAATKSLQRLVFVSSTSVYGEHDGAWIDEHTEPAPLGVNGAMLLEASRLLACAPCPTVELRLSGLYGPGRLQLLKRLRSGQARAPRDPVHWANRIHVEDAAAAIAHLLFLPDPYSLYLGADDTPLPLHELYAGIARLDGSLPPAEGPAPAGVGSKRITNARLKASGFTFQWPDTLQGHRALLAELKQTSQAGVSS